MVTLITEELQHQSLDNLAHKSCDTGPTLKNFRSLSSLGGEGEDDDDPTAKTAVSCPRDPQDPHGLVTPGPGPCGPREPVASEGRGSGDPSAWDSAGGRASCRWTPAHWTWSRSRTTDPRGRGPAAICSGVQTAPATWCFEHCHFDYFLKGVLYFRGFHCPGESVPIWK